MALTTNSMIDDILDALRTRLLNVGSILQSLFDKTKDTLMNDKKKWLTPTCIIMAANTSSPQRDETKRKLLGLRKQGHKQGLGNPHMNKSWSSMARVCQ